jgi:hypothetical protein
MMLASYAKISCGRWQGLQKVACRRRDRVIVTKPPICIGGDRRKHTDWLQTPERGEATTCGKPGCQHYKVKTYSELAGDCFASLAKS